MYTTDVQVRVRYAETDTMGVVYHGNYAQYFEVARVEAMRTLGISYREMEAMGIIMPVVELHTRFIRPAKYDDLLTIKTSLKEYPGEHRIEFHHDIYNEAGKHLTIGKVVLYILKATTMERTSIPEELASKLRPFFELTD